MNRFAVLSIAAGSLLLGACAGSSGPAGRAQGYVVDSRNAVIKDPFSLCWRTGYWTPALAIAECDPSLVPKPGSQLAAPRPAAPVLSPTPAPTPPAVAQSAPVAPIAPPPVAAVKPAAPKRCDGAVTFQTDELFPFNGAALTQAARRRIDSDVMNRISQCGALDVVLVTGHTDRVGSQQYNQKLSDRRAEAVKAYLAGKGVARDKIETMGMGKTAPAKFCPDTRNQRELVECLAPNRRVTIEIKGPAK